MNENHITFSKLKSFLTSDFSVLELFLIRRQNFSFFQRKSLWSKTPPLGKFGVSDEWLKFIKMKLNNCKSKFDKISTLELFQYCSNKLLVDCDVMSMKSSLEVRTPFLDEDFVKSNQNIRSKKELVSQFKDFPIELMSKRKTGFTLPFQEWMCFENENEIYHCIRNLNKRLGFSKDYLRDVLLKNKLKGKYSWLRVWQIKVLHNWLQENSDI